MGRGMQTGGKFWGNHSGPGEDAEASRSIGKGMVCMSSIQEINMRHLATNQAQV